jgi:hypothetical protein
VSKGIAAVGFRVDQASEVRLAAVMKLVRLSATRPRRRVGLRLVAGACVKRTEQCREQLAMKTSSIFRMLLVCALVVGLASVAQACPTCGEGMNEMGEAGKKMINGWFWSIVFMMSMPFTILSSLGGYMYYLVRKDRRARAAGAESDIPVVTAAQSPQPEIPAGAAHSLAH